MNNCIWLSIIKLHLNVCKMRSKDIPWDIAKPCIIYTPTVEGACHRFELCTKSTLSNCMSLSHSKTWNNPNASPTSTRHKGVKQRVLANTKAPSSSSKHMPITCLARQCRSKLESKFSGRPWTKLQYLYDIFSML